jgi:endonuclease/exonuclease/phosphatase family metal-dependent hydrolase
VLRVLTLNIWMTAHWRARRAEIVAWLERLDPHLVCLQEVVQLADGRNQARWLAEQAGYHAAFGPAMNGADGWALGNGVLSRWPIERQATHDLPFEPRPDDGQRVLLHAHTNGIDVFSTHLNWRSWDGALRERQVAEIERVVRRDSDPASPLPPIIAGDFNAEPDSTEMRYLAGLASIDGHSTYYQDAWRIGGGRGPGHTWDNRNTYAVLDLEPSRRIDYVLVGWRMDDGAGQVMSARVACDTALTGTFASDHFGLFTEITTTATMITNSSSGTHT